MRKPHQRWKTYTGAAATSPPPGLSATASYPKLDWDSVTYTTLRNVPSYRPNSERGWHFVHLWDAIDRMRRLPEEHNYHLNAVIADKAINVINTIHSNFDADLPMLLPEDSKTLVLTWEQDFLKRFLSISEHEQDLLTLNRKTRAKCDEELPEDFSVAVGELLKHLSLPTKAYSTSDNG